MKMNVMHEAWLFHAGMNRATEQLKETLGQREVIVTSGLDNYDENMPQVLTTVGLSRFGMAEVFAVYMLEPNGLTETDIARLISCYVNMVRWDHHQHLGLVSRDMSRRSNNWSDNAFCRMGVRAMEVDAQAYLMGYGFILKDIVDRDTATFVQLVVSDTQYRFPDDPGFAGQTQILLPHKR